MLITASRSWLENLTEESISLCRIVDGTVVQGNKPSVEIGFHRRILAQRNDINVVLHYQSTAATTIACVDSRGIDFNIIPEIPFYLGRIGHIPYIAPGSVDLAERVAEVMQTHTLALMQNHGQITVSTDFEHAIQNADIFELACEMIVNGGGKVVGMASEAASTLISLGGNV